MEHLFTTESLISFLVLTILEVILGIDNVIFVSIIMSRLPKALQPKARFTWMITGMISRTILLFCLSWLLSQKGKSVFTITGKGFDLASLVMLGGGLFLIYQIMLIDMVFSFDSIITAGGTAKHLEVMIAAVVIAMIVMFLFSPAIAAFIHKHPTLKMLALSFLVMIGFVLLVEGWNAEGAHELHLKNYVYFAMAFSFVVELLNMRLRKATVKPIQLREPTLTEDTKN
jgi:predicted tellurium resistance membrane protein TerC